MIRFSIVLVLLSIFTTILQAQTISGVVKNTRGAALKDATISLLKAADSSILKIQVSDSDGSFHFATSDTGTYLLRATMVGYKVAYSTVLPSNGSSEIILEEAIAVMEELVVNAKREAVQVKGDRLILNVEGTVNAVGNNALELLRKAPNILVNSEERISMNGKNGVQVFIDGKPNHSGCFSFASTNLFHPHKDKKNVT